MAARTEATPQEKAWWRKFRAVVKAMPATMEVLCNAHGQLAAAERGATAAEIDAHRNMDEVPTLSACARILDSGFENNSGSL